MSMSKNVFKEAVKMSVHIANVQAVCFSESCIYRYRCRLHDCCEYPAREEFLPKLKASLTKADSKQYGYCVNILCKSVKIKNAGMTLKPGDVCVDLITFQLYVFVKHICMYYGDQYSEYECERGITETWDKFLVKIGRL